MPPPCLPEADGQPSFTSDHPFYTGPFRGLEGEMIGICCIALPFLLSILSPNSFANVHRLPLRANCPFPLLPAPSPAPSVDAGRLGTRGDRP